MMLRYVSACALVAMAALGTPVSALTSAEKMETCNIGADHQKLHGNKRKKFLARCMADEAPEPAAKGK